MIRSDKKEAGEREEILAMWQRIFHDPAPYAAFYFEEIYEENEVLLYEDDEEGLEVPGHGEDDMDSLRLKGMLHLNPRLLQMQGDRLPSHYIVGVATDEEYRRQGIMKRLLHHSLRTLRDKGEMITFLMPASEDYYLPFGFRFGAYWEEIELEYRPASAYQTAGVSEPDAGSHTRPRFHSPLESKEAAYRFVNHPEDGRLAADMENELKDDIFCIHTMITDAYYRVLEKEAASEFYRPFYVYDGDRYIGRFVVGAQDNFMMLSRISCMTEDRTGFLHAILDFCEGRYHYGVYQITLDESWDRARELLSGIAGVRVFHAKSTPMIMFRLLNIEKAGVRIRCRHGMELTLKLKDTHIPEQAGVYRIEASADGCRIRRLHLDDLDGPEGEQTFRTPDETRKANGMPACEPSDGGGCISIGDFTSVLFGESSDEDIDRLPELTDKGKVFMKGIIPWRANCVMEYV